MSLTEARRVASNPSARLLASRHGIDVRSVRGSGPNGRVVKHDVVQLIAARAAAGRVVPSHRLAPPRITAVDCRVDRLVTLRTQLNANRTDSFSIDDLVLRAAALALREVPPFGAGGEYVSGASGKMITALAVSTDAQLIASAVHEAGDSLLAIRLRSKEIRERAAAGRLIEDCSPALCVGNIALHGTQALAALVAHPCLAVLAFGPVQAATGDDAQTRSAGGKVMRCMLMTDPDRVDAQAASAWLVRFQRLLECPVALLV